MSAAERLVRVAVTLLPRARRDARREEWLADLAGAEEVGIPRAQVVWGAFRAAASEGARARRASLTPRRVLIAIAIGTGALVVGAPVAAFAVLLAADARGIVTVEKTADGEREVFWRDYPGIPELDPAEVLAGPTLEEGEAAGRAMLTEIEDELTAELGLQWAPAPTPNGEDVAFPAQNYYGGTSMLRILNVQSRQATSVPATWEEKERALDIIEAVASRHGFTDFRLDHDAEWMTEEDAIHSHGALTPEESVIVSGGLTGPTGQWLWFTIQDMSLDHDGRFAEEFEGPQEYGWLPNSISFTYGANGLLPAADRAEFERRLAPYVGLERPEPLPS
jgi:hypothetical protein